MARKHLKPQFNDEDEDLDSYLQQNQSDSDHDEMETLSFGSLKSAQNKLDQLEKKEKPLKRQTIQKQKPIESLKKIREEPKERYESEQEEESENDENDSEGFFDDESDSEPEEASSNGKKKANKHAPKEISAKKRVKRIREIPGLENKKSSSLYTDIRFDSAFGKADSNRIRKDYKFLDEYREKEIQDINAVLKNSKITRGLNSRDIEELEYEKKSLKSRLDSLKNKELQMKVLDDYKNQMNANKTGNKFYLKKSEQRKIIQKHKFDTMKSSQREKVMERKRKRRLGREFRQLEFNKPRN